MILDKKTNQELEIIERGYSYNFGERKLNTDISTTLIIKGENISNVTSATDCGCTTASPNVIDKNTVEIDVIYKANHTVHTINRELFINYSENQENKLVEIKVTGQITE